MAIDGLIDFGRCINLRVEWIHPRLGCRGT